MAKSNIEKQIEKQRKEQQKIARQERNRDIAKSVVDGAKYVGSFRVMDKESETLLEEIIKQYDGNDNNYINFNMDPLPRPLKDSISVGFQKLLMYGVLSSANEYIGGAMITINESGKTYFEDKIIAESNESGETANNNNSRKEYDVFISHANKDKSEYVDSLKKEIEKLGINIFYDTSTLSWGDNWKQKIIDGVKASEFAIIVISKNFFDREWTEKELNEFLNKQNEGNQKIILPLLYGVTYAELKEHYPQLEDIHCVVSNERSLEEITILLAKELIKRYR